MCYKNYFLLDLRKLRTSEDAAAVCEISNVVFLLYAADLSDDVLLDLKQKCRCVLCFLPLSQSIELSDIWKYIRRL